MKGMKKTMVSKTQARRKQDIKSKLMAAIAMLLVSSIMMVSSTYAWFTLSTAPEVTGINTAVGANGNLEMALLPEQPFGANLTDFGITSAAGDSVKAVKERNVTWGNLVELADSSIYGLDKIVLYPSAINMSTEEKINTTSFLKTPQYGADGRVSMLTANTQTSVYDAGAKIFNVNDKYGVRAVGNASGMTDRQLSYRNAMADASTAFAQAKNAATISLNSRGPVVAQIAITHAANSAATHTQDDVSNLLLMVEDAKAALGYIEKGYMQYILAYAASSLNDQSAENTDAIWSAVKNAVEAEGATLQGVLTVLEDNEVTITGLTTYTDALKTSQENVDTAEGALEEIADKGEGYEVTWAELSSAMRNLVDPDELTINGYTVDKVKENLGSLFNGIEVSVPTGGGVYADIADHCGDYTADVKIRNVTYGGMVVDEINAVMNTKTTVSPVYSERVYVVVNGKAPSGATTGAIPISEFYGYIIDLAFRTNASASNLLLQTEAVDRIYSDNTNPETMGGGSYMTFASTTNTFTNDKVEDLMANIRLVFFNPEDGTVYTYGRLDMDNASVGADGVKAPIRTCAANGINISYNPVADGAEYDSSAKYFTLAVTYTEVFGINATNFESKKGDLYVSDGADGYNEVAGDATYDDTGATSYYEKKETYTAWTTTKTEADEINNEFATAVAAGLYKQTSETTNGVGAFTDGVITALNQNQAHAVSVLVYLDGNTITNADVAAEVATSMSGSMNIQFASSANLVPMDYSGLHQSDGIKEIETASKHIITVDTSKAEGATVNGSLSGDTYTFTLEKTKADYDYVVKAGAATLTADENGNYTHTATDNVTITVTANAKVTP